MIRIDLLRGHRRGPRRILGAAVLLAVLAALLVVGLAGRFRESREQLYAASWARLFGPRPGEVDRGTGAGPAAFPVPAGEPGMPAVQPGEPQEGGQPLSTLPHAPPPYATATDAATPGSAAPSDSGPAATRPLAEQAPALPAPAAQPGDGEPNARPTPAALLPAPASGAAPLAGPQSQAPVSGTEPLGAPQSHAPASGVTPPGAPSPAAQLPPTAAGSGQGRACGRLLRLVARFPASLRLANLACTAVDYQADGTAPADQVGQLHALLDSLRQLPSQPNLSLWRAGKTRGEQPYRFALQGRTPEPVQPALEPQTVDAAAALFGRVSAWARRARLQLLAAEALPSVRVAAGLRQDRLRVRVVGSGAQLGVLADSLRRVEARLGLDELVLAEVPRREPEAARLQLTAVLKALVQAPGSLP